MLGLLLPSNIKTTAVVIATVAVFSAGWYVNGMRWKAKLKTALERQMIELVAKCEEDKLITQKAGEEYEAKISTLSNRVMQLKRLQSTKCVSVANSPIAANGSPTTGLPNANGIPAPVLIDYASDAEKQRQQLISLQEFVRKVWSR